ncbi:Cytochrome P450 2L1-like 3 [Homarus americanus]|uniref:Cytochrome P450 2L1-like 3 n=1 Tax=Homarus americanus TaxID=6706 RepID=A0A8J5MJI7_HOMAM|nr:Cytochrome P450 2L1-like 3 [Homarus americanus]
MEAGWRLWEAIWRLYGGCGGSAEGAAAGDLPRMLVAVLVILLLALLYKVTQRPSGFPPGVWGWPIVGYVPPRDVPLAQHLNTLRKKFGDIFTSLTTATLTCSSARSYSVDDKEILEFFKMVSVNFDIIQGPAALLDLYPWLIHIMPTFLKNSWMRVNQLDESRERIHSLLKDIIDDHCKTLDTDNPRDYIDVYLTEHLKDDTHLPALGHQDILTNTEYINLLANLSDLFVAGSETTSSTLRWACLYLALHPEVQTKIQKEIDSVVPRDTLPSLEHKEEFVDNFGVV